MTSLQPEPISPPFEELLATCDDLADRFAANREESETQRQKLRTLFEKRTN